MPRAARLENRDWGWRFGTSRSLMAQRTCSERKADAVDACCSYPPLSLTRRLWGIFTRHLCFDSTFHHLTHCNRGTLCCESMTFDGSQRLSKRPDSRLKRRRGLIRACALTTHQSDDSRSDLMIRGHCASLSPGTLPRARDVVAPIQPPALVSSSR